MHSSRIHQHIEKNSVPLKEVLTAAVSSAHALIESTNEHPHGDAMKARKCNAIDCQYCKKCLRSQVLS